MAAPADLILRLWWCLVSEVLFLLNPIASRCSEIYYKTIQMVQTACGPRVFLRVSLNIFCLSSLYDPRCNTEKSYDLFYTMICLNVTYSCTCHALPWITGAHTHLCQCCKSQSLHLYPRFLAVCLSRVLYCAKPCRSRYFFSFKTLVLHSAGYGCQRKVKWKWTECWM